MSLSRLFISLKHHTNYKRGFCSAKIEVLSSLQGTWLGWEDDSGGFTSRMRPKSTPDWMQALQESDALDKKEDLQSWKSRSTSTKPFVVTWNFMDVLNRRREGVVREGVVEKDVVTVLGEISMPSFS